MCCFCNDLYHYDIAKIYDILLIIQEKNGKIMIFLFIPLAPLYIYEHQIL